MSEVLIQTTASRRRVQKAYGGRGGGSVRNPEDITSPFQARCRELRKESNFTSDSGPVGPAPSGPRFFRGGRPDGNEIFPGDACTDHLSSSGGAHNRRISFHRLQEAFVAGGVRILIINPDK